MGAANRKSVKNEKEEIEKFGLGGRGSKSLSLSLSTPPPSMPLTRRQFFEGGV
jgi:hypothetical protein